MGIEERIAPGCGLTKREWFAGMALAGQTRNEYGALENPEAMAERCFTQADFMMARSAKLREGGEVAGFEDGTAEYGVGRE